ncbi:MAG: putative DNA-binding transcriptional regulator YafY [Crocinitomix sp.]|jgi:predicted DNA-binding transcriptional regulator YafY
MNKFDRVVTTLMLLQTKKIVRAHELSDRFEVSLRTIYRDLKTLENAGVPIHAEAGVGYSLVDGYSLPPVMFTENEATSFIIAEKLVAKMTDEATAQVFSEAVDKIKAVLRSDEKEKIDKLGDHVLVSSRISHLQDGNMQRMPQILNSIDSKTVLEMEYAAAYNDTLTKREIEPLGIHFYSDQWHLIAFCRLRQAYRDFRIDRIQALCSTELKYEGDHPNLKEYLSEMAAQQDLTKVVIQFNNGSERYGRTEKFYHGYVGQEENEKGVQMELLTPSIGGTAHWLLIFTDQIEIIEPTSLKDLMLELAEKLVGNYR